MVFSIVLYLRYVWLFSLHSSFTSLQNQRDLFDTSLSVPTSLIPRALLPLFWYFSTVSPSKYHWYNHFYRVLSILPYSPFWYRPFIVGSQRDSILIFEYVLMFLFLFHRLFYYTFPRNKLLSLPTLEEFRVLLSIICDRCTCLLINIKSMLDWCRLGFVNEYLYCNLWSKKMFLIPKSSD